MTILKMAFEILAAANRPMSAIDLKVRLPVTIDNPRKLTAELRARGLIIEAYRVGRERFWRVVQGAQPPSDMRHPAENIRRARQHLALKRQAARARVMAKIKTGVGHA